MIETLEVLGLIAIMAVLTWFKLPQKTIMIVGRFLSKLKK